MSDIEQLTEAITRAIEAHHRPMIPVEHDLWDLTTVAAYFKRSRRYTGEAIVCQPTFPPAIRLPSDGKRGSMYALWNARDVIAWAQAHADGIRNRTGRPRNGH